MIKNVDTPSLGESSRSQKGGRHIGPVSTTNKQSMAYFSVKTIENATSYLKREWPSFVFKELLDNAHDWLNDYYPPLKPEAKEIRKITARIWTTKNTNNKFIHIAVRNSNVNNVSTFTDLEEIFDWDNWHGTKRDQHRMTAAALAML